MAGAVAAKWRTNVGAIDRISSTPTIRETDSHRGNAMAAVAIASALHYINKAELGEQKKLWTHCKCGQAAPGFAG